jgi:hypothetical protein
MMLSTDVGVPSGCPRQVHGRAPVRHQHLSAGEQRLGPVYLNSFEPLALHAGRAPRRYPAYRRQAQGRGRRGDSAARLRHQREAKEEIELLMDLNNQQLEILHEPRRLATAEGLDLDRGPGA